MSAAWTPLSRPTRAPRVAHRLVPRGSFPESALPARGTRTWRTPNPGAGALAQRCSCERASPAEGIELASSFSPCSSVTSASTWLRSCKASRSSTSVPTTMAAALPGMRAAETRKMAPSYGTNAGAGLPSSAAFASGRVVRSSTLTAGFPRREKIAPCPVATISRSGSGVTTDAAARRARSSGFARGCVGSTGARVASMRSGFAATALGLTRASSSSSCAFSATEAAASRARTVSSPVCAMRIETSPRLTAMPSATRAAKIQVRRLMSESYRARTLRSKSLMPIAARLAGSGSTPHLRRGRRPAQLQPRPTERSSSPRAARRARSCRGARRS